MTDSHDSEWWRKHLSRREALRAGIYGATIPGILYLAKSAASADAADGDVYIPGAPNFLELGYGWPGKEANAGKISYRRWSDALDIVGAGTAAGYRKVKIWDDLYVQGLLNLRSYIVDPQVPPSWTAFLYAKSVNGQTKPFWKDPTGTAQPLVARSATFIVAASNASPRSKLGADYVCDGTGDDVEIQAAIDALPSGGGRVVLTEGTFTLRNTIVLGSMGTDLEGQGYGTLIQFAGSSFSPAIGHGNGTTYRAVTDAHVRNLRIKDTDSSSHGAVSIGWTDYIPQRITIDHVEAENCDLWITCGSHHRIEHCFVHDMAPGKDCGITIRGEGSTWAYDSIIANNIIHTVPDMAIASGRTDRLLISNNRIVGAAQSIGGFAIDTCDSVNVTIVGNSIESQNGINSEDADGGSVQIVDNLVKGTGYVTGAGIQIQRTGSGEAQVDRALICGNALHNMKVGITAADQDRVAIINNVVGAVGANGIEVRKNGSWGVDPSEVLIQGNMILRWAANDAYQYGISAGVANVKVSGNYLEGDSLNNNRGIGNLTYPAWITDNVIRDVGELALHNIAAGVSIRNNFGYVTENSGTATIASGGTYFDVPHGLSSTPNTKDISVTPTNSLGNASKFWISNVGGTTFRININTSPGPTTATFAWHAQVL